VKSAYGASRSSTPGGEQRSIAGVVMEVLPHFAANKGVVAIGQIGYDE